MFLNKLVLFSSLSMVKSKKVLNKEQKKAVSFGKGPLLIIAGAGTGKTTVITERIKYLIASKLAKPTEILALTFTQKAALEMEERVDKILPYGYTQMWISTFHSFCDRILRQEAFHIGLNPHFILLTEAEALMFLKKHIFAFKLNYFRPTGNPYKFLKGLFSHFSRLKDEDISVQEYLQYANKLKKRFFSKKDLLNKENKEIWKQEIIKTDELARAFKKYEELKTKEGVMDFADLISNTLKLLRQRKNILKTYQQKFKYILVDEFQDTNIAQNELVMLLAAKKANLTVVADDDQSIYRFRGSSVSNVMQFKKTYKKAKIITLTKNYRSTQEILNRAYDLIQYNNPDRLEIKEKIDKKLISVRLGKKLPFDQKKGKIKFLLADRVENEADKVAKEIKKITTVYKYKYKDIAILVRANNHANAFIVSLIRNGIPFQFLGPGKLLRQEEVLDLIAYLKVLYNFEDSIAFFKILSLPIFSLNSRDIAALKNYAKKYNLSFFEAAEKVEKILVSKKNKEKINKIVKMVHKHLKLIGKETAGQILYYFLNDSGLLQQIANFKTEKEEQKANNIAKFFDTLKTYEVEHEDAGIEAVVDWLNLKLEMGESSLAIDTDWMQENKVNILTVHSSKGLEFPVVILPNLVMERFPTRRRSEQIPIPDDLIKEQLPQGDYHEQEERRLFYVAMTRAKDLLYFSAAQFYGEGKRLKKVSPFVYESLGKQFKTIKAKSQKSQLSFFDFKPSGKKLENKQFNSKITYLSYSQLETFKRCPLQYKYKYILQIPTPVFAAASFGTSLHNTLKDFYVEVKNQKFPSQRDLFRCLKNNWQKEGYTSKSHEKDMLKKAKNLLTSFYEKSFNKTDMPLALEQNFNVKVSPGLKVGGRIDRLDKLKNGKIEIIDYKTGKVMTQKEVDKSIQMTVYTLAVTDPGIYNKKPRDIILSFYFLKTSQKFSTTRSTKDLKKIKKTIMSLKQEIETSDFLPKPSFLCDFCDYKLLCPAWQ
ncbi:ATP-dependent helicase [Patescibacteria group bacterium]